MSLKTLWEIDLELQEAIKELIDNEGELTDELNEVLNINQSEFQEKATNYVYLIKGLENEVDLRKAEIKRLQAKNEAISKTLDTLKSNLLKAVKLRGGKVQVADFNLSTRSSKSTSITDITKIPFKYQRVYFSEIINEEDYISLKEEYNDDYFEFKPDKVAIKKAIEDGETIEGAEIITNESLTIK